MGIDKLTREPTCDMEENCANAPTHIGEKGYIYCASCAPKRRTWERCRKMATWEVKLIREGKPLPSYEPVSKEIGLGLSANLKPAFRNTTTGEVHVSRVRSHDLTNAPWEWRVAENIEVGWVDSEGVFKEHNACVREILGRRKRKAPSTTR